MKKMNFKILTRSEMKSVSGGKADSTTCVFAQYQYCDGSSATPCLNKVTNKCDTCCLA